MRTEALREACDRNLTEAFAALIPHTGAPFAEKRSFGPVVAVATGASDPFFNPVMITDPAASADELAAAVGWIRSLGVSPSVELREDLRERLEPDVLGLEFEAVPWATPGMALHPIPRIPSLPPELRIEPVDFDRFEDWFTGISYGPGLKSVFVQTLLDDPSFRLLVGYVGDDPVTGAAAIMSDEVVGVYAVGTAEQARRRGFGQAATWAAIRAGSDAGCSVAVLQSSEMGLSLYRQMGFIEVCGYVEYLPASAEPAADG